MGRNEMSTEKKTYQQQCLVCMEWYDPLPESPRVCLCSFCQRNIKAIITREQSTLGVWGASLVDKIERLTDDDHSRYSRIYHALHSTPDEELSALRKKIDNTKLKNDAVSEVLLLQDAILLRQERIYTLLQLQEML
jgi:hypothetical protein